MQPLVIFVGAGIGGVARYAVGTWVHASTGPAFPWGTLLINVMGSFLLMLTYGVLEGTAAAPEWRAFLGVGVLGGFTTFSAFSYETVRLMQDGEWARAVTYVLASVLLSVGAAMLAVGVASVLFRRG